MNYSFTRTGPEIEAIHETVSDPSSNESFTDSIAEEIIPEYTDIVYKSSGSNSAVDNMVGGFPAEAGVGDIVSTGGTTWKRISKSTPTVINDFYALNALNVRDFGATGDGLTDDTAAVQSAITNAPLFSGEVFIPTGSYRITASLNATNFFSGLTISADHSGKIPVSKAVLVGETGDRALIDTSGTQGFTAKNFAIKSGDSNGSAIGILLSRSSTSQFAQFNKIDNVTIDLDSDSTALGGLGTFGIYNFAAEISTYRDTYSRADTGIKITNVKDDAVLSDYQDLTGVPNSTSTFYFEGNTVFDSKNAVGDPAVFVGAVAAKGLFYVNGINEDDCFGVRFVGINKCHELTVFSEFSRHLAEIDNGFSENTLTILNSFTNTDKYIIARSAFNSISRNKITLRQTITGIVPSPDVWIQGNSGDVFNSNYLEVPAAPASRIVSALNERLNTFKIGSTEFIQETTSTQVGTATSIAASSSSTVTFPAEFRSTPIVVASHLSSTLRDGQLTVSDISQTGFTVHNWSTQSTSALWIASV